VATRAQLGDAGPVSDPKPPLPYGTIPADATVSRADFERGLRAAHISVTDLRDDVHRLAAQVVALTEELARRIDGPQPEEAAPRADLEAAVTASTKPTFQKIQAAVEHANSVNRLHLGVVIDKYDVVQEDGPPCLELLPICHGRCCRLRFPLTTQDLDEGVVRWDYGRPYMIRQRSQDGYCVHNHPEQHGCTVYQNRPAVCRVYDCRKDKRVWFDYEQKILATAENTPPSVHEEDPEPPLNDLMDMAHARQVALTLESLALHGSYPEVTPREGVPTEEARIDPPRDPVRLQVGERIK
jgi:Fe-S-cluster containining protein